MKRGLDFVLALLGLLVTLPFWVVLVPLLAVTQGFPILFVQQRVGLGGRPFSLLKFRTMKNDNRGGLITVAGDSRVTAIGKILRKLKLDELPQLLNVLRGDMSFVGPRPEVEHYVKMYSSEQRRVLDLMPGITDPASLTYFNESEVLKEQADPEAYYVGVLMPEKIRINMEYGFRANVFTDLWFIVITALRVFGIRVAP